MTEQHEQAAREMYWIAATHYDDAKNLGTVRERTEAYREGEQRVAAKLKELIPEVPESLEAAVRGCLGEQAYRFCGTSATVDTPLDDVVKSIVSSAAPLLAEKDKRIADLLKLLEIEREPKGDAPF